MYPLPERSAAVRALCQHATLVRVVVQIARVGERRLDLEAERTGSDGVNRDHVAGGHGDVLAVSPEQQTSAPQATATTCPLSAGYSCLST